MPEDTDNSLVGVRSGAHAESTAPRVVVQQLRFALNEARRCRSQVPPNEVSARPRYISIAITKIEEAILFLEAAEENRDLGTATPPKS